MGGTRDGLGGEWGLNSLLKESRGGLFVAAPCQGSALYMLNFSRVLEGPGLHVHIGGQIQLESVKSQQVLPN